MNIYNCPLYKLILNEKNKLERRIYEDIVTIEDLVKKNYNEYEKNEILKNAINSRDKLQKEFNSKILKFKHCGECKKSINHTVKKNTNWNNDNPNPIKDLNDFVNKIIRGIK